MEKGDDMRRLMEQLLPCLYSNFVPNLVNNVTQDSFVPSGCMTKNVFQKFLIVLSTKQLLISQRWENFVAINCLKMLFSHETFLEYIIFACIMETALSDDVFDSVVSASALLIAISIETLEKTGVNFLELTVDIFMAFYNSVLKEQFCKEGGFEHFTGYLHEYLKWECYLNDDPDDCNVTATNRDFLLKNANDQLDKELKKVLYQPDFIDYKDIRNSICHSLAKEVLSVTEVKLPTLPSLAYQNAVWKQKVEKLKETNKRNAIASKSGTTSSASKFETIGALKSETRIGALKSETTIGAFKSETKIGTLKSKTAIGALKSETRIGALKSKTIVSASKSETRVSASKSETRVSASKSETRVSASKSETRVSASKSKTTSASKSETMVSASKSETRVSASKSETRVSASKSETMVSPSKSETTISTSKSETTAPGLQGCSSTVADSPANFAWCDSIVRSVINYNNLKSSNLVNVNKRTQKVDEILEHMKDTIKSLVKVLEVWDKE